MTSQIVFLGPPASGKGTQAALLSRELGLRHISTGELLRAAIAAKSPIGLLSKAAVDTGTLVPDHVISKLLSEAIRNDGSDVGRIFDGFPRTAAQALTLDSMLEAYRTSVNRVILFEIDPKDLVSRMQNRVREALKSRQAARVDDSAEVLSNRVKDYQSLITEVIAYYENHNVLFRIDASKNTTEITAAIRSTIL